MSDFCESFEFNDPGAEARMCAEQIGTGLQKLMESQNSFDGSERAELKEACELMERSLRYGAGALEELSVVSSSSNFQDSSWMSWLAVLGPNSHQ